MRSFEKFAEVETEGARDAEGDGQRGVGLFALDLAEHGTADAAGVGERFERPAAFGAEAFDADAEVAVDRFGLRRAFVCGFLHVRYSGESSCISDETDSTISEMMFDIVNNGKAARNG